MWRGLQDRIGEGCEGPQMWGKVPPSHCPVSTFGLSILRVLQGRMLRAHDVQQYSQTWHLQRVWVILLCPQYHCPPGTAETCITSNLSTAPCSGTHPAPVTGISSGASLPPTRHICHTRRALCVAPA
jgi:hypothetical protein